MLGRQFNFASVSAKAMRATLTVSVLLFASATGANAQVTNAYQLTGPVKTSRLEVAKVTRVNGENVEGARILVELLSLDEQGKFTAQTIKNSDGSIKRKYGWNSTYDPAGKLTRRQFFNASGVETCVAKYEQDESGRLSRATFYCSDSVVNHRELYFYDNTGTKVRQVNTNPDGTAQVSIGFVYQDGRLAQENYYRTDGSLAHRNLRSYDEHGNQIEFSAFDAEGGILLKFGMTYSVDSSGKPAELRTYSRRNVLLTRENYTYEFDSHGNWTKRTTIKENFGTGNPTVEVEVGYRTLTYY
jgi:hypothetical protein